MLKILIIQTAFIGDVVLATGILEKLHRFYPDAQIDFLLRKGNEGLLANHPFLHEIIVWEKKHKKWQHLFAVLKKIRKSKHDQVINLQRFASTGFITAFSKAKEKIGFDKNPFSFLFTKKIKHIINDGRHEIERNNELIKALTDTLAEKPKLHPSESDYRSIQQYTNVPYVCIAPSSVWYTKQYHISKWIDLVNQLPVTYKIFLLGGTNDTDMCREIINSATTKNIESLSGKLNFLQSAALMKTAVMNYVNDSAPLHFASAMNAPVTAIFCSTVPTFGFGPLADRSFMAQTKQYLTCKPCTLHGRRYCPLGHFKCALTIETSQLLETLN